MTTPGATEAMTPEQTARKMLDARYMFGRWELAGDIAQAIREAEADALRRAIDAAEAEEELEGAPPDGMVERIVKHPAEALRAAVRTTKRGIIKRIRSLLPKEEGK